MKVLKIVLHTSKTVEGKGYSKISTKAFSFFYSEAKWVQPRKNPLLQRKSCVFAPTKGI